MTEAPEKVAFAIEVNQRFNDLVAWVAEHASTEGVTLEGDEFAAVREEFCRIACGIHGQAVEPEPSEGGAQYVSVTPAPWP